MRMTGRQAGGSISSLKLWFILEVGPEITKNVDKQVYVTLESSFLRWRHEIASSSLPPIVSGLIYTKIMVSKRK